MIREYPTLTKEQIDLQGKAVLFCDEHDCKAKVEVSDIQETETRTMGTLREASMPDGWVSSDPYNNPLNGGAIYCPKHADRIYVPEPGSELPVIPAE